MLATDLNAEIIALVAVAGLVLVMRWVFGGRRRPRPRPVDASAAADLGLLVVLVGALSRAQALRTRGLLADARIRASLSRRRDGGYDVLVFAEDRDRAARALLS